MDSNLVVTITGPDKIGLVERVSKLVVECHGNIAASRMAHLGGEFAMLMNKMLISKLHTSKVNLFIYDEINQITHINCFHLCAGNSSNTNIHTPV